MISWEPTPPNCAVTGLAALLSREEWRTHPDGARIRQLLRPQIDSTDNTVRMLASMALPLIIEPENLTDDLCNRLSQEKDAAVIEILTGASWRHMLGATRKGSMLALATSLPSQGGPCSPAVPRTGPRHRANVRVRPATS